MNENSLKKFQDLLRTLFQFDCADLDFGIYRILNYKRGQVETFITQRLPQVVDQAFAQYAEADTAAVRQELEQKQQEVRKAFGDEAIDERGQLRMFRETPLGKQYLALQDKQAQYQVAEELKARVYNDLYTFFSRYYEDGDFISKRRYGRHETYAIPYNGEEVVLYWANRDQYYIKTGDRFKAYRFKVGDYTVAFELRNVAPEQNGNGKKRYFVLAQDSPITWNEQTKTLSITFEYRPLTEAEEGEHGRTEQQKPQDSLNEAAEKKILDLVADGNLKVALAKPEGTNGWSLLRKHLTRFTRKNTADFFIHKDLGGFLRRELDFFIKNEVLLLDELIGGKEEDLRKHILRARVVRQVAEAIIDFLAQVEDFQKKLWEKRKFVLRTEYCLTIDRVPKKLWAEVLANEAQVAEWRQLYALDELMNDKPLLNTGLNRDFLKAHPTLVVDTRHFPEDFKWRLLSHFKDLDEALDGLLIKSENWQALNLLLEKYREKVKCIYIDPPFNTGTNEFLYRNNYLDSSWITMLYDRVCLGKNLLCDEGSMYVRIDYHGNHYVRHLMNEVFGRENFRNELLVRRGAESIAGLSEQFDKIQSLNTIYDNLYWYSKSPDVRFDKILRPAGARQKSEYWHSFWKSYNRPNLRYELFGIKPNTGQWLWDRESAIAAVRNYSEYLSEREKTGVNLLEYWIATGRKLKFLRKEGSSESVHSVKYWVPPRELALTDNNWLDIPGYASHWGFKTENSEVLLKRAVEYITKESDFVLDFFLGSGSTTATAHKINRKWVGIEVGDHFHSVVLPRMRMVLWGDKSGISKEVGWHGGGFFKYQYLEQYEDTLNNLELPRAAEGQLAFEMFGDEYLLKYMLDFETQGSASLLNLDMFKDPFAYKLKVQEGDEIVERPVDLVETFNYLLGIHVSKIKSFEGNGRLYRAVLGEKNGKRVAIVWRSVVGLENNEKALMQDKDFIKKRVLPKLLGKAKPDRLLVNGACFVKDAEPIEPEFHRLMFAPVGV